MIRLLIVSSILFPFPAYATQWKHAAPKTAQTQSDCITAYLSVCGNVVLEETAIRACIAAHKFSPECLELAKGIK